MRWRRRGYRWRAVLAGSFVLTLGACASSSKAPEGAKAEKPEQASSGLGEDERKALLAIFANPGGSPQPQPPIQAAAPAAPAAPAERVPSGEMAPVSAPAHEETARAEETPSTRSAYEVWFGGSQAAADNASLQSPVSETGARTSEEPAPNAEPASQPDEDRSDPLAAPVAKMDAETGAEPVPPADAENPVGVLPPQQLAGGTCGMFLWMRQADAKLVFFSYGAEGAARMNIRDRIVDLRRVSAGGMTLFGQFERQTFQAGTLKVDLTVDFARRTDLLDGAKVPQGRLRLVGEGGWSYVLSVAGLIGCQTAEAPQE